MPPKDLRRFFTPVSKEDHQQATATELQAMRDLGHAERHKEVADRKRERERELATARKRKERERKANPVPTAVSVPGQFMTGQTGQGPSAPIPVDDDDVEPVVVSDSDTEVDEPSGNPARYREDTITRALRADREKSEDTLTREREEASLTAWSQPSVSAADSSMVSITSTTSGRGGKGKPRTNYLQYWSIIDETARQVKFKSSRAIEQRLKDRYPETFAGLSHATVGKWMDTGKPGWTAEQLQRVEQYKAGKGVVTRSHTFQAYPGLDEDIAAHLLTLREKGLALDASLVRAVIIKHVRQQAPQLMNETFPSLSFVYRYLKKVLHWSFRMATRPARKRKDIWQQGCIEAIHRMVLTMDLFQVPPALVINGDQAGVEVVPGAKRTWNPTGSKQVEAIANDDKRQFTVMVTCAMDGSFLPFQSIVKGATDRVLPRSRAEAESLGFRFEHNPNNHWSSIPCLKSWINNIIVPYIERVKERDHLPESQHAVLYIDCWSVHRSAEFRHWMWDNHPKIIMRFVPATCTGDLQPADVGLQRLIKHNIRRQFSIWLVNAVSNLPADDPEAFRQLFFVGPLREQVPGLLVHTYNVFSAKPELVRKAWSMSKIGDLHLGLDHCTSEDGIRAAKTYQAANPDFAKTIAREPPPPSKLFPVDAKREEVDGLTEEEYQVENERYDDISVTTDVMADAIWNLTLHERELEQGPDGAFLQPIEDDDV